MSSTGSDRGRPLHEAAHHAGVETVPGATGAHGAHWDQTRREAKLQRGRAQARLLAP